MRELLAATILSWMNREKEVLGGAVIYGCRKPD